MASVVLIAPDNSEVTISTVTIFERLIYGKGYRPKTGTVDQNRASLLAEGPPPTPDPAAILRLGDLQSPTSDASAALREAFASYGGLGYTSRGAWASGQTYAANDIVLNAGAVFRVTRPVPLSVIPGPTAEVPGVDYEMWIPPSPGVPVGGGTGSALTKTSGTDYDTGWTPATDVATPHTIAERDVDGNARFVEVFVTQATTSGSVARLDYVDTQIAAQIATRVATSTLGAVNGVATLDSIGRVPAAQIPAISLSDFLGVVATQAAMLLLVGQRGDWCTRSDLNADYILIADNSALLASWRQVTTPGNVTSVVGAVGAVNGTQIGADPLLIEAIQDLIGAAVLGSTATGIVAEYDDTTGKTTIALNSAYKITAGQLVAAGVMYCTQNANGTWPNRPTARTDVLVFWVRVTATGSNPIAAVAPAVNGAYPNDIVIVGA